MLRLILCIVTLLCFDSIHAQTFNGTGGAIPDGGGQTCFNITVSGVGNINGTYGLASVCLDINHTYVSDLEIYLKAPDGTTIPLSIQNGDDGVNYTGTCFTATAVNPIWLATAPFTGNFLPEGNLGAVNNGQNANGTWSLCIQDLFTPDAGNLLSWNLLFNNTPAPPPVIPVNDNPCNAITLPVGSSCNYSFYTNENATNTAGVPAPGCANYSGADVWFQVTVPAGGALIFDTQTGVITDGGMAIYSGTCGALTLIDCNNDASQNGLMPMIGATGLTPGSTIWIRVWDWGNFIQGTFGICVTTPPAPPVNDDPCNAIALTVNSTCNFSTYSNVGATNTPGVPAPGCGNYQGADVWFTVTVPAAGSVFFDSNTGTMIDGDMAVYTGTCNALTLLRCDDFSSANGVMPSITLSGLTPGSTLWVRFWGYGANNTGTFQLCASVPPPPTVQDCPAAIPLCQNVYNEPISYNGTGNIPNEINPVNSCLSAGERADVWYTFTVQNSGNLSFTITPNLASEDYDWAVYNLTGATCADIYNNAALNVSCNFSATPGPTGPTGGSVFTNQGAVGTPYNAVIPVLAGQTYVINVSNYSLSTNGYSINFGASTASIFDNIKPSLQSVGSATACGGDQLTLNFSENILCNTVQNADFNITGPGGPYTVTGWSSASCSSGATYGNNIILTVSPAISTNGAFQVCLNNSSGSVTDLCGNVANPACLNFTIATVVPTFTTIAPICSGSTAPVLPTTSNNGITGTWSPATVSNTTTTTYTFTPVIGQCATTATLSVTVTPATIPTFNAVAPICSGSLAPVLPTTSTNGIIGTWSPATVSNTATAIYTFTPSVNQCAIQTTLTVTVTSSITPTFTAIGAICTGSTAPVLPTTSNNGITGNWLPATVSNTSTTTYTFTPNAGQCATITTLTVNVTSSIVPTFTAVAPICNGSTAPVLPTTSNNGITGTWSPATVSNTATTTYTFTPNAGQCGTITTLTVTVTSNVTPTFTAVAPICSGSTAPILPTTSNNGITGTWSPATVSNTATATYIFTPNAGQCATATTLTVTVTSNIIPTFTAVAPICSGSTAPVLPTTSNNGITGTWSPATVSNTATATYTFTPNAGQCATATTLTVTVTSNIIPTFTAVAPICSGSTAPVLPTTSNNGITGTWSPATVSNTATATYTFTPNAGQCATATTLTVTVTSNIIPTFTAVAPICSGSTAPVLPTTSNNGITGTWSPATVSNTATATYTFTPTPGQCATTTTLTVTINPVSASTTSISICPSQLPYTWNGQTYPTGGTYSVTLINSNGCDSVATLNLSTSSLITPTFTAIAPICSGSTAPVLPTTSNNGIIGTWSPATVSNIATATYTFTPTAGQCATTTTLTVTVNPTSTSTTAITICPSLLPYTWNGQTYPTGGTYSVTLINSNGCDSVVTLNLSTSSLITPTFTAVAPICSGSTAPVLPTTSNNGLTGTWSPATVSNTATGTYTFTPNVGQCATTTTLTVTVKSNSTSTTAISICPSQLPYTWNSQTYPTGGTYSVTLVNSVGCDSVATLNLSTSSLITPTFTAIAPICSGSTAPVLPTTSNNGIIGTWSPATVSNIATATYTFTPTAGQCATTTTLTVTVNPTSTSTTAITICPSLLPYTWNSQTYPTGGTYSVTLVNSVGCDSIATLNLSTSSLITPTFTAVAPICSGSTAPVLPTTSNNGIIGTWSPATVSNIATATYTFTPTAGQCATTTTLTVTVNPTSTSTTAITICPSLLPYTWNGQTYPTGGTYSVTLINSNGCDSVATLNLSTSSLITPTFTAVAPLCSGSTAPILPTTSNNGITGTWSPATVSNTATVTYTFTPTASQCATTTTLTVTVNPTSTSTTAITICPSQLPYTWNSQTYPTGGTYSVTLINSNGCDSVATLNLSTSSLITPTFTAIAPICSGSTAPVLPTTSNNGITGTWSPATVSNTATATYTFTPNAGQCATATTLTVTVTSNIIPTFTAVAPICSGSTAPVLPTTSNNGITGTWSPATVSNTATATYTFTPTAGQCATTTTLTVTVKSNSTSTTAISICPSQLPYTWNGQTYPTGGTYSVTLVNSVGCDSVATLNLSTSSLITPTFTAIAPICSGSTAPVLPTTSNNGIIGTWSPATVSNIATATYTFTPTAGQCATTTTLTVTVNPTSTSTTAITICPSLLPYTWNGQTYPTGGTYSVTLINSNGCDSVATLNLSTSSLITPTFTAVAPLCSGSTAPVLPTTSNNGLTGTWSPATVSNTATGTYTFTPNVGQCATTTTLTVTVKSNSTSTTAITICPSQLPYTWNSQTYPTGGTYSVTLVNSVGCDSVATLNLSTSSLITPTFTAIAPICSGSTAPVLPTTSNNGIIGTWSPATVSNIATATYTFTPTAGQCATTTTLTVTVNPTSTSTTAITICPSLLPYTWNSQTYPTGGTYSVTLVNSVGCDSIATLNLSTSSLITPTFTAVAPICSGSTAPILPTTSNNGIIGTWSPATVSNIATATYTFTPTAGQCATTTTLTVTVNPTSTSTTAITICPSLLPYTWNSQTYPTGGTYSVTLVNSVGCDSIATLNLSTSSLITPTFTAVAPICSGSTAPILPTTSNNGITGTWSPATVSNTATVTYTFTPTASQCATTTTLTVTVNPTSTSTTAITICPSQLPYTWNSQTYPTGGTYSVTLINSNGCDSVATLNLSTSSLITPTFTAIAPICSGSTAPVLPTTSNNGIIGTWSPATVSNTATATYTFTPNAGQCATATTLTVTVNATSTSTTAATVCSNQLPYLWNGQSYSTGGAHSVTLVNSNGCDSTATLNLTIYNTSFSTTAATVCSNQLPYLWNGQSYSTGGAHSVALVNSNGCDSTATLNLTIYNTTTSTTTATVCSNQLPYLWNGQSYSTGGAHSVALVNSNGCDSTATLNLTIYNTTTSTTSATVCSNQLPYLWNGQSYSTGGAHSVTLVNSNGCDSTATLNLTIYNTTTSTTSATVCSNQLPYLWNGQSYSTGGVHSVALVNSNGCDSTATLNLTIYNTSTSSTAATVCSNQLPYLWNGQSYSTGGAHSVALVNSNGCDSTATLNLTIYNTTTSSISATVCSNQLPYLWNGQSYSTGGAHSVTLVNSNGCDSTATLNLTIYNTSISSTAATVCSNQLPYLWNGQSYSTGGAHSVTLVNSNGCDSTATLNLTIYNTSISSTAATVCSNQLPYLWNGQSYSTGGAHSVTLVNSNGCDSIATLNLTIYNTSTSTTSATVCSNQLPYLWNGQSYSTGGVHSVTLVNSNGCDSTATLSLTIYNTTTSSTAATVCSNQLPYLWNGQSYSTGGAYSVTLVNSNGCDSVAKLSLIINPAMLMPSVTSPVNYCQYANASALAASGTGNLIWYTSASGGTGSSIAPTPSTINTGVKNYYVSQSAPGICESPRAMITVNVYATPKLGTDKDLKICYAAVADLNNMYNTSGTSANWAFNNQPVIKPDSVTTAGIYQLIAINASGCADTALVHLTVQAPLIAFAGNDANTEYSSPYQLTGTGTAGTVQYEWSPASVLNNPYTANPLATLTSDTRFILTVKDDIGCKGTDTVNIRVFKGPNIYVPTAFSPNGDGLNEIFRPTAVGMMQLDYFRVYNRYSELIFESHDFSKGWDGTYKGMKQNPANYVWILKATDRTGKSWEMKGNVVLIR